MRIAASGIVVNQFGQVLLIQRDDTLTWAPPGGALDAGELPPDGAAREVEEETGLKVEPARLVEMHHWPTAAADGFLGFTFRCLMKGGELATSAESLRVGYCSTDPLPRPMFQVHRERIEQALAHTGGPVQWSKIEESWPLRLGRLLVTKGVYPLKNVWRRLRGRPRYQPPPDWKVGAFTIIRNDAGEALWVKRTDQDMWNLPGGGSAPRESPWETAVRETYEETGLEVRLTDLTGVYVKPAQNEMLFAFTAVPVNGRLTLNQEAAGFAYFAPGSEPDNVLPKHPIRVADADAGTGTTVFRVQ